MSNNVKTVLELTVWKITDSLSTAWLFQQHRPRHNTTQNARTCTHTHTHTHTL